MRPGKCSLFHFFFGTYTRLRSASQHSSHLRRLAFAPKVYQALDSERNAAALWAKDSSPPWHKSYTQSANVSGWVVCWRCFEQMALASSSWASLQPCDCTILVPVWCFFSKYAAPAGLPPKVTHDPGASKQGFWKFMAWYGMVWNGMETGFKYTQHHFLHIYICNHMYISIDLTALTNSWEGKSVRENLGYYTSSVRNPVRVSHVPKAP